MPYSARDGVVGSFPSVGAAGFAAQCFGPRATLVSLLPGMPGEDGDAVAWRRFLGLLLVGLAGISALAAGCFSDVPDPVPGWALQHAAVWRLEVFAALFALAYATLIVVALAFHGKFFTSFSTPAGGASDPKALADQEQTAGLAETNKGLADLTDGATSGFGIVAAALQALADNAHFDLGDRLDGLTDVLDSTRQTPARPTPEAQTGQSGAERLAWDHVPRSGETHRGPPLERSRRAEPGPPLRTRVLEVGEREGACSARKRARRTRERRADSCPVELSRGSTASPCPARDGLGSSFRSVVHPVGQTRRRRRISPTLFGAWGYEASAPPHPRTLRCCSPTSAWPRPGQAADTTTNAY